MSLKFEKKYFKTYIRMKDNLEGQILAHSSKTKNDVKIQESTEEKKIKCQHCGQQFQDKTTLRFHILEIIRKQEMIKNYAEISKKNKKRNNIEIQEEIELFDCAYCGKQFIVKDTLKRHILKHMRDEEKHKCKHCKQHFLSKQELEKHNEIHTNENEFTSEKSTTLNNLQDTLKANEESHNSECNICKQKIFISFDLKIHRVKVHNECSICKILFPNVETLKDHLTSQIHEQGSTDEILKILNFTITLDDGILNKRIFSCHICNKHFQLANSLDDHLADHQNEMSKINKFTCTYCKKLFTNQEELNTHIQAHTNLNGNHKNSYIEDEKTHLCRFCQKCFSDKRLLKQHISIHIGEKCFLCDICFRPFTSCKSLNSHKKAVHTQKK